MTVPRHPEPPFFDSRIAIGISEADSRSLRALFPHLLDDERSRLRAILSFRVRPEHENPLLRPYLIVARIVGHLIRHPHESLNPDSLAHRQCTTSKELRRMFNRILRKPPREFLMELRVARAKELLETTDTPIRDIALEAGFYDHSAFTRHFTKITGTNPSSYRLQAAR